MTSKQGAPRTQPPAPPSAVPTRPSVLRRLSRHSVAIAGRTSMVEIAAVADRIAAVTERRVPRRTAGARRR